MDQDQRTTGSGLPEERDGGDGPTICEKWVDGNIELAGDFKVQRAVLWIVGALITLATLLVAAMIIRRSGRAKTVILQVLVVQILAAIGEVDLAFKETERIEELYQLIWPGVEYHSMGQIFLNQEWIGTAFGYGFICVMYFVLTRLIRSKKMTA